MVVGFPSPYDAESMERLVTEVKPALLPIPATR
jgi:hypothetical protein